MGFGFSTRNHSWAVLAVSPHQHNYSSFQSSQAYEPLFAVRPTYVLAGEHRLVENSIALGQINCMLTLVALPFTWVVSHGIYCICIYSERQSAISRFRAQQASRFCSPLKLFVRPGRFKKSREPFDTARQQLEHASIAKREFTGVGFFTEFEIADDAPIRRDLPDATLGNVGAELSGLQHGAGFLLFIRGGVVTMLEGYTYADDQWPERIDEFRIFQTAA